MKNNKEKRDFNPDEETDDERFLRTGIASVKFEVNIKVTESDMLKDLVNKTERKNIRIKPISEN